MKRALALILVLVMALALVSCGGDKADSTSTDGAPASSTTPAGSSPAPSGSSTTPSTPAEPKILKLRLEATPASTWAATSNTGASVELQRAYVATLYRTLPIDGKAQLVPQLAASEPVDVSGNGTVWNIAINPDAKWENGEPINADTFVYTMKKTLDPKTVFSNASGAASYYVNIVNAAEYYAQGADGTLDWEDVGFKKVDDLTVQITTAAPVSATQVMRHFTTFSTAPIYEPLFEECLAADGLSSTYGTTKETSISCGAYKISNWVDGSTYELVKNEHFVQADLIKLDGVTYTVVEDPGTMLQMFEKGELDYIELDDAGIEKFGDDPRVSAVPGRRVYTVEFCVTNTEKPIISNENFKLALFWGTNREELGKLTNLQPATGLVGTTSNAADGVTFRELAAQAGYEPENYGYDPELAKQYYETALKEAGITSLNITMLVNGNLNLTLCEYLQESWKNLFGADKFNMEINFQSSGPAGELRRGWKDNPNSYEIACTQWNLSVGDFDPIKALQPYTTTYSARNAPHEDATVNALYAEAHEGTNMLDQDKRNELAMEMEQYLLEHAIVVPLVYETNYEIFSDRVVLPTENYDIALGWGHHFGDIIQ